MATYNALLLAEQVDDLRAEVQDLETEVAKLESVIESARDELIEHIRKTFGNAYANDQRAWQRWAENIAKKKCPSLF